MNMPVRAISEHDERRSSLIRSLSELTKLCEAIFPSEARDFPQPPKDNL